MRITREKVEKMLDKLPYSLYNLKAVKNAAIAQSVERILGKDEVASSNLASSSIFLSECKNAAIAQSVERILGKDEVASSNLASSSIRTSGQSAGRFYIPLFLDHRITAAETVTASLKKQL